MAVVYVWVRVHVDAGGSVIVYPFFCCASAVARWTGLGEQAEVLEAAAEGPCLALVWGNDGDAHRRRRRGAPGSGASGMGGGGRRGRGSCGNASVPMGAGLG